MATATTRRWSPTITCAGSRRSWTPRRSPGDSAVSVAGDSPAEALRPFHLRVALLASLAFGGNGIDAGVVSFAMPGVREEWGLTPLELGLLLPSLGIGQLVGSIVVG